MTESNVGQLRELAQSVLDHVNLSQVALISLDSKTTLPARNTRFEVSTEIGVRGEQPEVNVVQAVMRYEVKATTVEGGEPAWNVIAEWIAEYRGEAVPDLSRDALLAFALIMGPQTVHPYGRQLIQDVTSRGPYPAYTMELIQPLGVLPDDTVVDVQGDVNDLPERDAAKPLVALDETLTSISED